MECPMAWEALRARPSPAWGAWAGVLAPVGGLCAAARAVEARPSEVHPSGGLSEDRVAGFRPFVERRRLVSMVFLAERPCLLSYASSG